MKERVYFAAGAGRIKIGTTRTGVERRVGAISSHLPEPLTVIGSVDGGLPYERAIQHHLAPYCLRGEWFQDCEAVRQTISRLIAQGPDAIGYDGIMFSSERKSFLSEDVQRPWNPAAFGRVIHLMWGKEAIANLAEFCEVSESEAALWIEDCSDMPRLTAMALSLMVMDWLKRGNQDKAALDENTKYFLEYEKRAGREGQHLGLQSRVRIRGLGVPDDGGGS